VAFVDGQREDGGIAPPWQPDYSSIDATCFWLTQTERAGWGAAHPGIQRAIAFLMARQSSDGSFSEAVGCAAVAPPWLMPGEPAATIYLTAHAGFWLALYEPVTGPANAAARYLHNLLQKGDALPSYPQANWLAAGLWHRLGWMKPFDYAMRYLSQHAHDLDVVDHTQMRDTLRLAGVPGFTS
jgi:hypothetical protein